MPGYSSCSLNIWSLPAWDPMGVMAMALRALKFYGTDPGWPLSRGFSQGLPLQFCRSVSLRAAASGARDSTSLPGPGLVPAAPTFEGDWRRLGTLQRSWAWASGQQNITWPAFTDGFPSKSSWGICLGAGNLFSWTTSTLWLGFQASEAYLIKQSSGYREATSDGSRKSP